MPRSLRLLAALLFVATVTRTASHPGHAPGEEMAAAAGAWLRSLDDVQRARAVFPVAHGERENWHFVPLARQGIPLKDMTDPQRALARALVAAGLSERGLLTTDTIIALEEVLHVMEGSARRDSGLYYFTVFGTPDPHGTWGWRFEGHHVSVNFLVVDGARVSATPMFFGSNPAEVRIEHPLKGRRNLAAEEDQGRALMKSLTGGQRAAALIAERAPSDIITGHDRQASLDAPAGLAYAQMTADQQARLRALVEVYAGRLRADLAKTELQKIADRGWDSVHFAWAGGLEPRQGHYYRIHGPDFVIEYDNTQDHANHIHTVWRSFEGDFGRDLLREHHDQAHTPAR